MTQQEAERAYTTSSWERAETVPCPGLVEHHPWPSRHYLTLRVYSAQLGCEGFNMSIGELEPGQSVEHHRHGEGEEVYVLIEGTSQIRLDDEVVEAKELDAFRIPHGVFRSVYNHSDRRCRWLFVGSPPVYSKEFF
jgi:uncharacterized cupin superfamily protein